MKHGLHLVFFIFITSCATTTSAPLPTHLPTTSTQVLSTSTLQFSTPPIRSTQLPLSNSQLLTPSLQPLISPSPTPTLNPADWKNLPVIPHLDSSIRAIYEYGQTLGNDPHSFSIFGDCQTRPSEFFGVFETNPATLMNLSPELNETVEHFRGSFNRESPTVQDGTTPGALLWIQWHRGEYGCTFQETPVECELRMHRPSFVIIQIGTHFESRNTEYLRKIITQLMDAGVIPILATKADNREKDERVNIDMAMLALEYDLPLWNFWAAVSELPERGLYTMEGREEQGAIYLTPSAQRIHRNTGLEALNTVWRIATSNPWEEK